MAKALGGNGAELQSDNACICCRSGSQADSTVFLFRVGDTADELRGGRRA